MDWLRWDHGTATDPKWRIVAADSGQRLSDVIAVWAVMLEFASQADERGTLAGWNDRVAAVTIDLQADQVAAIREAMQDLVLDGLRLKGWERRQPKREDGSAERAKAWREARKSGNYPDRTQPNANERTQTQTNATDVQDKTYEQKEEKGSLNGKGLSSEPRAGAPTDPKAIWFDGKALRLNQRDFELWQQRFGEKYPDLWDELTRIDSKLSAEGLNGSKAYLKAEGWLSAGRTRGPPRAPAEHLREIA